MGEFYITIKLSDKNTMLQMQQRIRYNPQASSVLNGEVAASAIGSSGFILR